MIRKLERGNRSARFKIPRLRDFVAEMAWANIHRDNSARDAPIFVDTRGRGSVIVKDDQNEASVLVDNEVDFSS